ncbi:hypothetical protein [Rhodococcus sp. USK13]|nr:hypothetical protein [Rhodococcus sp. USK13]
MPEGARPLGMPILHPPIAGATRVTGEEMPHQTELEEFPNTWFPVR